MASRQLPSTMRKLVCTKISSRFRESTAVVEVPVPSVSSTDILIKNKYVGINASDINFTAGRYDPSLRPPFDIGFEGLGEVVAAGNESRIKVGQSVLYISYGAFAEYKSIPFFHGVPVPDIKPQYIPLILSGLTAAVSLGKMGEMIEGEKVLVTAAAGGTGQFAVQLAKLAGCHVIGTCSTDEKVEFLKSLGCDRPINYKKESLKEVLKKEYPKGIDIVYESVGGDVFNTCVDSLATKGRLLLIGFISGYESQEGFTSSTGGNLLTKLLTKSASVRGFFLFNHTESFKEYLTKLTDLLAAGKLKSITDNGDNFAKGPFVGLESIPDAIDYMYSGLNKGKIVAQLNSSAGSKL